MDRLDPIATAEQTDPLPSHPLPGIAFWNAVRALNILGAQVLKFPDDQRNATTITGLRQWFKTWKASGDTHHEILARVPMLVSHTDSAWLNAFFDELTAQQHPALGTWPAEESTNISRTFAYSLIYTGMDKLPPQPEKIVDAKLNLQREERLLARTSQLFNHGRGLVVCYRDCQKPFGWRET